MALNIRLSWLPMRFLACILSVIVLLSVDVQWTFQLLYCIVHGRVVCVVVVCDVVVCVL